MSRVAGMKVVHLHFGKEGGAERFFVNLANALGDRGIEQEFIIRPDRIWRDEISGLGRVTENNFRLLTPSGRFLRWNFARRMRREKPTAIMAWAPRASRLMPDVKGPMRLTRLGDFPKHLEYFQNSDVIVGNIPGIVTRVRELGWHRDAAMISNFPKPISAKPIARAEMDTPTDAFVIAGSGRFVHRKGFDLLMKATARLPGAYLWLMGEGEEREALEELAKTLDMTDRVRFSGWVPETAHYVASADIFCMPSRHEPLGNVLLEAWEVGVPTVSSRSEGPDWFMRDGRDGLMFDIDDLDGLTGALEHLRASPELRASVVAGARETLQNTFSTDRIVDQYIALFQGQLPETS